jgi:cytidine deaminase
MASVERKFGYKLGADQREALCNAAKTVATSSYSPYSRFRVGAAVLCNGRIYSGANVENASFGLGICAERSAIAAAVSAGETNIQAIAIACIDASPDGELEERLPCGTCRQWLVELAPNAVVIITDTPHDFAVEDLLPHAFRLPATRSED